VDKFDVLEKRKAKDQNYVHWLEDPSALGWLRNVFKEYLDVQGAMACLQPWSTPTPEPQLTVEAAPLRLLMRGNIESWNPHAVEDLRELSLSQWHEPLNLEDDWLVALFGKDPAKASEASSSSSPSKLAIKDKIDSDDDEKAEVAVIGQEHEQLVPREMDEENPDGPAEHPGSLKPIFDFRRVFTRLPKLAGKDDITAKRLILGLHERLWHAGSQDIKAILQRCGMPPAVWRLTGDAVASCRICRRFARSGRRPQYRGADLSMAFNEVVQIDLSFQGIRYGKGMKTIWVPKYSKGTLITWTEGRTGIAVTEHNTDSIIHIKELFNTDIDKLCHLYLFGYVQVQTEDSWISARISRQPHAQDLQAPMDQQTADETRSSSTSTSGQPSDLSIEEINKKREGPVEIVVQAPERKKAKLHFSSLLVDVPKTKEDSSATTS